MRSSVRTNVPSSSSHINRTTENEVKDRDGSEVETAISDLNRSCEGLGHEVSRLILDNIEKNKKLLNLKRRIEEFDQGENQLNHEIEQLERKVLMLMLEKDLTGDNLKIFEEEKEIEGFEVLKEKKSEQKFLDSVLEVRVCNDKFKKTGVAIEETCEKGEVVKRLGTDPAMEEVNLRQLASSKKELAGKFENMWNVVDEIVNVSDDGKEEEEEKIGETGARELCKEIEVLEAMLARGSLNLLDLQMMMEEVEALRGPEKMVREMEVKMGELETELCELKNAITELKGKKSKELMSWVTKEEEKELECEEEEEKVKNARKINWGSIITSVGAVVVAAAVAVVFMRHTRVDVKAEKGKKRETG